MINNGTLIVIAAILVWITMCFPVEGRKGLILMLVRGILYLLITGLLLYVIVGKYPELGWAFSIIVLSILDVLSIVYALWCIYRAGKDLKTRQTKMVHLHCCKLRRGKTVDDGNGTYQLFGVDDQEIKWKFRISKSRFQDLLDASGNLDVWYYPATRIVDQIKERRRSQ